MATKGIATIENYVYIKAQQLAVLLKARSINFNLKTGMYTYYCNNDVVLKFSLKELTSIAKREIIRKGNV